MTAADVALAALPRRLHDVVRRWARRAPRAPALVEGATTWRYEDLAIAVDAAASWLGDAGVRPGDRVMIVNENSLALAALLFGVGRLDAWPVLVNARLTPREIAAIHDHCAPRRVAYTDAVSEEAAAHAAAVGAVRMHLGPVGPVSLGPLGGGAPEPVYDDAARQVGALIYTTGTTGAPKGVMLSHRNLLYVAAMRGTQRGTLPEDRVYGALPISHIFGLASTFLRSLYGGACCLLVPRFSPEHLADALAAGEITILQGVPAMHARLLEYYAHSGRTPSAPRLRLISAGGGPLDPDLKARVEAAFGLPLINGYGLTETAATVSRSVPSGPGGDLNVGPPMPGIRVRVVDGRGAEAAAGATGELWLKGPSIMLGYYREPAATAAVLTADGWFKTGDVARLDDDGNIHIVDRGKEVIIRSGFNVYPTEVEAVLSAHPRVTLSAVVGRRAAAGNEEVIAFVQPAPGGDVSGADLTVWLAERLAPYKRPARIVVMDTLPAAATGKVLKAKLRELAAGLD